MPALSYIILITLMVGVMSARANGLRMLDTANSFLDSLTNQQSEAHYPILDVRDLQRAVWLTQKQTKGCSMSEFSQDQRTLIYRLVADSAVVERNPVYRWNAMCLFNSMLFSMKYPDALAGKIDDWRFEIVGIPEPGSKWAFIIQNRQIRFVNIFQIDSQGSPTFVPESLKFADRFPIPSILTSEAHQTLDRLVSSLSDAQRKLAWSKSPLILKSMQTSGTLEADPGVSGRDLNEHQRYLLERLYDATAYFSRSPVALKSGEPMTVDWDSGQNSFLFHTNSASQNFRNWRATLNGKSCGSFSDPGNPTSQSNFPRVSANQTSIPK